MCSATFFLKFSLPIEFPTSLKTLNIKAGTHSVIGTDQIQGLLRNLNTDKSMEPDKIASRGPEGTGRYKQLSITSEKSGQSSKIPSVWKRENIAPIYKMCKNGYTENCQPVSLYD